MTKIINLVLFALTIFLGIWLYKTITDPVAFHKARDSRRAEVVSKLKQLQIAQDIYRAVTGKYANSFDDLFKTINEGEIDVIKLEADPTDPTNQDKFVRIVSKRAAKDSIRTLLGDIDLNELRYVPFTNKSKEFSIAADTLTYQRSLVQVVEVGTRVKDFMGEFADPKYKKYDKYYDPEKALKFGDMTSPNTNGNW